jgi:Site-specific recombinases, DNA invertase Pin homologs
MKIGYARVSTKDQNLDMQTVAFRKEGCEKIYFEKQSSLKERPALLKALDELRAGDTFYIWSLDRLGRKMSEVFYNLKIIEDKKVILNILTLNIDTSTPNGKIILWAFGLVAELEMMLKKERTEAGIKAAMNRGIKFGRKKGLSKEAIRKAYLVKNLYLSKTCSVREIAQMVNISTKTLYKYLKYLGVEKHLDYKNMIF